MAGRHRRPLSLSAQRRQQLQTLVSRLAAATDAWARVRILLDYNTFHTNAELARHLGVSESLVSKTLDIYSRHGWKGLTPQMPSGPPSHATPEQIERVKRLRREGDKRRKKAKLSYAEIAKRVDLHPSSVVRILKRRRSAKR